MGARRAAALAVALAVKLAAHREDALGARSHTVVRRCTPYDGHLI